MAPNAYPKSLRWTHVFVAGVLLATRAGAGLTAEQKAQYRELRKDFFIALAVPGTAEGKPRAEHRRYVKASRKFIAGLGEGGAVYRAAVYYFCARIFLQLKYPERAREDLDKALELLTDPEAESSERPSGLPARNSIRILRAFTLHEKGVDAVLDALEAIPDEQEKPKLYEVGHWLSRWADALSARDRVDEAIRAYQIIKRFDLWEDEQDNPSKNIQLLKYRKRADGGNE